MRDIQVKVLNPESVKEAERMMVTAARLTQRGHIIHSIDDFEKLYNKSYKTSTVENMVKLPHPTIQKFGLINVVIIGASRRFLAQITRHQNEVKFMSASLQYSDWSGAVSKNAFTIPYSILDDDDKRETYINSCINSMGDYKRAIETGMDQDEAGYMAPQSLRNVLIISATPYQWSHMISQRTCRRNTDETRIVMLKIWEQLYDLSPEMFSGKASGPFCMSGPCKEGKMTCGNPIKRNLTPHDIITLDYPKL